MPNESKSVALINGRPASGEELTPLAFAGFAHFTAMQVRGRRVRGLDLHLERLRAASVSLYGREVSEQRVRMLLSSAIEAAPQDVSLVATIYLPAGEFTAADGGEPNVLIRTSPPSSGPTGPLSLASFTYERVLPQIKHVGEVAKTYYMRKAIEQGHDDAAFITRDGRFSEASIWNLAFWDGAAVIWPDAPMLIGTTMSIVRRQLDRLGIPQQVRVITAADLPNLAGAAVMNSWTPGIAIRRISNASMPDASAFVDILHRAYEAEPLVSAG